MLLFMIILEFVLMMILPWLIVYAVNGEDGLDYIITRAELSGSEKTLAKNSGWFRALQPVIELLLTAAGSHYSAHPAFGGHPDSTPDCRLADEEASAELRQTVA